MQFSIVIQNKKSHYRYEKAKVLYGAKRNQECSNIIKTYIKDFYKDFDFKKFKDVLNILSKSGNYDKNDIENLLKRKEIQVEIDYQFNDKDHSNNASRLSKNKVILDNDVNSSTNQYKFTMESIIAIGTIDGGRYKLRDFYKSNYSNMSERSFIEYFLSLLDRKHAFIVNTMHTSSNTMHTSNRKSTVSNCNERYLIKSTHQKNDIQYKFTMESIIAIGTPNGRRYKLKDFYKSNYGNINERSFIEYFISLLNRGHAFIVEV
ncbi:hypothetical protein CcarbDRAFT_1715 [Clostridium carboxidivorans P7]|uniref:Uncharacterized protein n=1 Tax=Clostridium carboxidivorans P7 TaxID=536227 RepID=C6PSE8_9CLOT|nr:hypothetical protein CcarbDRAFT_1715 [Clostridium carboxidivorans P7]